jgi:hypothetical protein
MYHPVRGVHGGQPPDAEPARSLVKASPKSRCRAEPQFAPLWQGQGAQRVQAKPGPGVRVVGVRRGPEKVPVTAGVEGQRLPRPLVEMQDLTDEQRVIARGTRVDRVHTHLR